MGADRAAVYVHQYGPPPAISAMVSAARVQREDELWRTYMAEISWIPAALMAQKCKPPRFPDLLNKCRSNCPAEHNRSADDSNADNQAVIDRVNQMIEMFAPKEGEQ